MHVSIEIAQYLDLMTVHGCLDIVLGKTIIFLLNPTIPWL